MLNKTRQCMRKLHVDTWGKQTAEVAAGMPLDLSALHGHVQRPPEIREDVSQRASCQRSLRLDRAAANEFEDVALLQFVHSERPEGGDEMAVDVALR